MKSAATPLQDVLWGFFLTLTTSHICNSSFVFPSITKPPVPAPATALSLQQQRRAALFASCSNRAQLNIGNIFCFILEFYMYKMVENKGPFPTSHVKLGLKHLLYTLGPHVKAQMRNGRL